MTDHDDDLDLKTLWQSTPPIDLDELLGHVDGERRRMRNLLLLETVGTFFGIGVIWLYYKLELITNPAFGIVITVAAVACQIWMWMWRRGQWRAVSEAPLDLLELQMKRAHTALRIGKYYAWGTPIAAVVGVFMAPYLGDGGVSLNLAPLTRQIVLVGLLAMLVSMTWFGVRLMRRSRAQIAMLTERLDALRGHDD